MLGASHRAATNATKGKPNHRAMELRSSALFVPVERIISLYINRAFLSRGGVYVSKLQIRNAEAIAPRIVCNDR